MNELTRVTFEASPKKAETLLLEEIPDGMYFRGTIADYNSVFVRSETFEGDAIAIALDSPVYNAFQGNDIEVEDYRPLKEIKITAVE